MVVLSRCWTLAITPWWLSSAASAITAASASAVGARATTPARAPTISRTAPVGRAAAGVPQASASTRANPNGSGHSGEKTKTEPHCRKPGSSSWLR